MNLTLMLCYGESEVRNKTTDASQLKETATQHEVPQTVRECSPYVFCVLNVNKQRDSCPYT